MKIIKIKHEQKVGRSGKNYESCQILTTNSQGQETWISGFGSEITRTWQTGDEINVDVSQNERGYWNFRENNQTRKSESEELKLLKEINRKLDALNGSKMGLNDYKGNTYQNNAENVSGDQFGAIHEAIDNRMEINPEDIPF